MDPTVSSVVDTLAISVFVVALVQLLKWQVIPDRYGPLAVLAVSLVGVAVWAYSKGPAWERSLLWEYAAAWIGVATQAAGIYGFTRASAATVTRMTPPPSTGAGSEPTV